MQLFTKYVAIAYNLHSVNRKQATTIRTKAQFNHASWSDTPTFSAVSSRIILFHPDRFYNIFWVSQRILPFSTYYHITAQKSAINHCIRSAKFKQQDSSDKIHTKLLRLLKCFDRKLSQIISYFYFFKKLFPCLSPRKICIYVSLQQLFCSNQIKKKLMNRYTMIISSSKSSNPKNIQVANLVQVTWSHEG